MSREAIANPKTRALARILQERLKRRAERILVVGCGNGIEAAVLRRHFGANVIGIDVGNTFEFDEAAATEVSLLTMDAQAMDFPDNSFDMTYSFHAIEHIADPEKALSEMARVLKPDGLYCVGVPNSARIFGYIGSPVDLKTKIEWNLNDWKARARGEWRNECGAHAGFSRRELSRMCLAAFGSALDISVRYYRDLYPGPAAQALISVMAATAQLPCCYVTGCKSM